MKEKLSLRKKILPAVLSATVVGLAISGCGKDEQTKPLDKTFPHVLSLDARPGYEVVEESDGRIWMPNVDKLTNGTQPTTVVFTTSPFDQNQTRTFNGINARIIEDINRNKKIDPKDRLVVGGVNRKEVTLTPGTQYIAEIGPKNGSFSLEVN